MRKFGASRNRFARAAVCAAAAIAPLALIFTTSPSVAGGSPKGGGTTAASSLYQVQLGYADNDRPVGLKFPSPWAGDPGVVYDGCDPTTCIWDGGAIRIINTSGTTLNVVSVIAIAGGGSSPCVNDLWQHNRSLPSADSLILTQQTSNGGTGCATPPGTFDTSDMGIDGVDWSNNCTQSGLIMEIDVTVTDPSTGQPVTTSYFDTGQILNKGGIDVAECPAGTNESTQLWTPVGQTTTSTFVISDLVTSTDGSNVDFWGAQWAKDNDLKSTGVNGFKGFAPVLPAGATCGDIWQSTPGNSSDPPNPPLPASIPIIVTGPITKVGNIYSGTIEHILLVSTNPGYGGNPGHAGTGTVVSEVC